MIESISRNSVLIFYNIIKKQMPYVNIDGEPIKPPERHSPPQTRKVLTRSYFLHSIRYRRKSYQKRAIRLLEKGLKGVDSLELKSGIYFLDKAIAACPDQRFDCIKNLAEIYRDAAITARTVEETLEGLVTERELAQTMRLAIQDVLWFAVAHRIPGKCSV